MATELAPIVTWTFIAQCEVPAEASQTLVAGETPMAAFKTFRDTAIFTNKRLIISDAQGLTGKKVEVYSIPWSTVNMWSTENAGTLDFNSEVELWTKAGHLKINLKRGVNVREIDRLIGLAVLS